MNYVTSTFMKSFNPQRIYDTTSRPTLLQVASYIPVISGKMDGRFAGVGVSVPITTSPTHSAYLYVKYICALGVAGTAEDSAFMGGNKNESEHAKSLLDRFEEELKAIENNSTILTSLISGTRGATINSYEYSNIDKRRTDNEIPVIRGRDNW